MSKVLLNVILIELIVATLSDGLGERYYSKDNAFVQRYLNKRRYLEGRVRIIGPSKFEGNVYIYHAGQWGAICDDLWNEAAASVVCRFFNSTSGIATDRSKYGKATEKFWMDDVVCNGQEGSLSQCRFSGWGLSDCDSSEAAGVVCTDPKET